MEFRIPLNKGFCPSIFLQASLTQHAAELVQRMKSLWMP
jgi:hypothetical protein